MYCTKINPEEKNFHLRITLIDSTKSKNPKDIPIYKKSYLQ